MIWRELKKSYKVFILFFLVSFLVVNWNDISWLFNYRFLQSKLLASIENKYAQRAEEITQAKENSHLSIPSLGVAAPIIYVGSREKDVFEEALKKGIVHYPTSALPGYQGQTELLGHSAPDNWPDINYDNVFSRLDELEKGDKIFLQFGEGKYTYRVVKKKVLEPGEEIFPSPLTNSDYLLVLVSCWPPGSSQRRIAVMAELNN